MKTDTRILLVRLVCLGVACLMGWPLLHLEPPRKPAPPKKPAVQRVRLHAPAPRPVEAATREQIIIRSETAPKKPIVAKKQKPVVVPPVVKPAPAPDVVAPEPVPPSIPQLVFEQTALPPQLPPAPPDSLPMPTHLQDLPGGTVTVLAVQLNSDNIVVLTDILVESSTPLTDLALALGMRGTRWKDIDPPIPAGETRWIEVRFDAAPEAEESTILP